MNWLWYGIGWGINAALIAGYFVWLDRRIKRDSRAEDARRQRKASA